MDVDLLKRVNTKRKNNVKMTLTQIECVSCCVCFLTKEEYITLLTMFQTSHFTIIIMTEKNSISFYCILLFEYGFKFFC